MKQRISLIERSFVAILCLLLCAVLLAAPCAAVGCAVRCAAMPCAATGDCGMATHVPSASTMHCVASQCAMHEVTAARVIQGGFDWIGTPTRAFGSVVDVWAAVAGSVAPEVRGRAPGVRGSCWRV